MIANLRGRLEKLQAAQLACVLVTAYFSYGFFQIDESIQILGFLATKLGIAGTEHLPWEYTERLRPWFQISIYYAIAKVVSVLGITSPDALSWVFRTVTGVYSFFCLCAWTKIVVGWIDRETIRRHLLPVATMLGFLPYLMVRVSSETTSGATLALAAYYLLRGVTDGGYRAQRHLRARDALVGGILLGVAFEFRFQTAIAGAGLVAWLLFRKSLTVHASLALAIGGTLVLGAAAFIDRWGYGHYCFPPWRYLATNIGVSAARFGTAPWFAYLYLPIVNLFFPIAVLFLISMFSLWVRRPGHVLTWMTLPFFLAHSVLGHKEERFLFPLVFIGTAIPAVVWSSATGGIARFTRHKAFAAIVVWNFVAMAILMFYPLGWNHHMAFAAHMRRTYPDSFEGYATSDEFWITYVFYRPKHLRVQPDTELEELDPCATTFLLTKYALATATVGDRPARLLYTELPFEGTTLGNAALAMAQKYNTVGPPRGLPQIYWTALYSLGPRASCPLTSTRRVVK